MGANIKFVLWFWINYTTTTLSNWVSLYKFLSQMFALLHFGLKVDCLNLSFCPKVWFYLKKWSGPSHSCYSPEILVHINFIFFFFASGNPVITFYAVQMWDSVWEHHSTLRSREDCGFLLSSSVVIFRLGQTLLLRLSCL